VGASALLASSLLSFTGLLKRLLASWRQLAGLHVELAKEEAKREADRLLKGVLLLACGAVLLVFALTAGHAVAAIVLAEQLDSWWQATAIVGGVDALLGVVLLLAGRSAMVSRELMEDSRARLSKAAAGFRK
jgi:hypothetical protein